MQSSRFCCLAASLIATYVASGALANFAPADARPLVLLCLITILSMVVSASLRTRPRWTITAIVVATVVSMCAIYGWRRMFDPMAAVGSVPSHLEPIALVILGTINIAAAIVVAVAFSTGHRIHRSRWIVFGATTILLLAFCLTASAWTANVNSPQALLRRVVMLEQSSDRNSWGERQELSTALAILGRQREARGIPLRPDAVGHKLAESPDTRDTESQYVVTPWREAIAEIASEQRLVLIMEAHTVTEHRAWIEQTLGFFREAKFTHYFAETISESGATLKSRGYPTSRTGFYTLDPRFGNLVRTAIRLDFDIGGYDVADSDFDRREEYQANMLAERFSARSDSRIVVHAGHAHVMKHEAHGTGRYMAARLWEKTGVEPFTIWQLSNDLLPNDAYRTLIRQIGPITEPVLLVPPPQDLTEKLLPMSSRQPAVDAIVVHPPRLGQEPTDRRGAFIDPATRVSGVWEGNQWPVVIAAHRDGESDDAIALDQIMLRRGETEFELWLPHADYRIRVWSVDGLLSVNANISTNKGSVRVEIVY